MNIHPYAVAPMRISLLLALVLTLIAPLTQAEETASTLAYHPAELSYADGQQSVLKRIRDVARDSCPRYGRVRELAEIARCRQAAIDDLVNQIGDPEFTTFAQRSTLRKVPQTSILASH